MGNPAGHLGQLRDGARHQRAHFGLGRYDIIDLNSDNRGNGRYDNERSWHVRNIDDRSGLVLIHGRGRSGAIPLTGVQLNGAGSSFAAPAIENFTHSVGVAPYNLNVNYSSTSSGDGRFEFASQTTNFAVSDIAYGLGWTDTTPPSFPFIYVPVTAGGIAFMYNIPGLTKTLQLSSYTACALLTGGITNWNDPALAKDNPGVTLPNLTVRPVTESDSAGTNYVLEEWCLDEQPALWAAFANAQNHRSMGGPGDGVQISARAKLELARPPWWSRPAEHQRCGRQHRHQRRCHWGSPAQVRHRILGSDRARRRREWRSVLNASGDYVQPTPVDVASALAYATQLNNGTHQLNFNGAGSECLQPVHVQLPPDQDDRMGSRGGRSA